MNTTHQNTETRKPHEKPGASTHHPDHHFHYPKPNVIYVETARCILWAVQRCRFQTFDLLMRFVLGFHVWYIFSHFVSLWMDFS